MKKRISLIAVMVLSTIFSQAQQKTTPTGGTSFGLRAGVNFQNINGKDENDDKLKNDMLIGFNVGINAEIPVGIDFYFQPGLLYSIKGAKSNDDIAGQSFNTTLKISYLELPLNFLYKPMLGNGHLILGFGPYVAFGIGGKATYDGGGSGLTEKIKFQKNSKEFRSG